MANRNTQDKEKDIVVSKDISALDILAKRLLSSIDKSYNEKSILSEKNTRIQRILDSELNLSKGVSNNGIVDFIAGLNPKDEKNGKKFTNAEITEEFFTQDVGNLFGYFQDQYRNRYIELNDLKFVSKFIPALGEAVKTTLEAIVGSDDYSTSVTRLLEYGSGLTDNEKGIAKQEIEKIEEDNMLLPKLKNTVYKNTLITGNFYVYAVAYEELFNEYSRLKANGKFNSNPLNVNAVAGANGRNKKTGFNLKSSNESFIYVDDNELYRQPANESSEDFINFVKESEIFDNSKDLKSFSNTLKDESIAPNYIMADSDYLIEALEGMSDLSISENYLGRYSNTFGGVGTIDTGGELSVNAFKGGTDKKSTSKAEKFKTKGTYIKYIDANHIVPIEIFQEVVGYLYVHDSTINKKNVKAQAGSTTNNMLTVSSNLFNSSTLTEKKKDLALRVIVDTLSDSIVKNFSNKFVSKNPQFKKLIADCIVSNGLVNNEFQIQFIPAQHIIPFSLNSNENGKGESILQDSLFPAKMLLSLVVSKLLTYMNKSGNKTIAHIKKGPINVQGANHVQRTIRQIQESQITFSDLLSTNLTFSKFSRDGNIQFPQARNGDKLVEFEIQEGQNVDMKTDMEEWLEKNAIMGTGVPTVIMEYTDAADYSKSITTGQLKFASRTASNQADLEIPTTKLYKILIQNSNMPEDIKLKVLNGFKFKLPRPKVLSSQNIVDFLQNIQQGATNQVDILLGTNDTEDIKNYGKIKDTLIKKIVMGNTPFIDWEELEQELKSSKLSVIERVKLDSNPDSGDDTGELDGGDDE